MRLDGNDGCLLSFSDIFIEFGTMRRDWLACQLYLILNDLLNFYVRNILNGGNTMWAASMKKKWFLRVLGKNGQKSFATVPRSTFAPI